MTEKELLESLHTYLAPAVLHDSRKQALLRQIRAEASPPPEKGEPTMFRPNKFRTALVLAAIVTVLSFTVALAAGLSGYINIQGERVDMPDGLMAQPTAEPPHTTATEEPAPDNFTLTNEFLHTAPAEYLVTGHYVENESIYGFGRSIHVPVESYEQLVLLVDDGSLMLSIPEGFEFCPGYVTLSCSGNSAYELVSEETTPEGITLSTYRIPEGQAIVQGYSYTLRNADGDILGVTMDLSMSKDDALYHVREEDVAETISLPGMEDALLITRPDETELFARRPLAEPISVWSDSPITWERDHAIDTYDMVTFSIYNWGSLVPSDWDENEFSDAIQHLFDK